MMPDLARRVWREGFAPLLPKDGLLNLLESLRRDDPRILQGQTVSPVAISATEEWSAEAACPIGYAYWTDNTGVGQLTERFSRACQACDITLDEPAACRWFLQWVDKTPREEMLRDLIPEVEWALETLHGIRLAQDEPPECPLIAPGSLEPRSRAVNRVNHRQRSISGAKRGVGVLVEV